MCVTLHLETPIRIKRYPKWLKNVYRKLSGVKKTHKRPPNSKIGSQHAKICPRLSPRSPQGVPGEPPRSPQGPPKLPKRLQRGAKRGPKSSQNTLQGSFWDPLTKKVLIWVLFTPFGTPKLHMLSEKTRFCTTLQHFRGVDRYFCNTLQHFGRFPDLKRRGSH